MGKFSSRGDNQPVRVPPSRKEGKPSIGEQKVAAASGKKKQTGNRQRDG